MNSAGSVRFDDGALCRPQGFGVVGCRLIGDAASGAAAHARECAAGGLSIGSSVANAAAVCGSGSRRSALASWRVPVHQTGEPLVEDCAVAVCPHRVDVVAHEKTE